MDSTNTAFEHLQNSIPTWLNSLTSLSDHLQKCQQDLQVLSSQTLTSPPRKTRTGSMESLRAVDLDLAPTSNPQPASNPAPETSRPVMDNLQKSTAPFNALRRKRKAFATPSLASAAASNGEAKYRTRNMIIVYYDSAVQDSFEAMVREIGTARCLIRKAKAARRLADMTAAFDAATAPAPSQGSDEEEFVPKVSFVRRSARGPMGPKATVRGSGTAQSNTAQSDTGGKVEHKDVFDLADDMLDKAQRLCETGAHQFLRDGDCEEEIEGIRAAFEAVLQIDHQQTNIAEKRPVQNERENTNEPESKDDRVYKPKRIRVLNDTSPVPVRKMSPGMVGIARGEGDDDACAIGR